jgi:hypothetical protein
MNSSLGFDEVRRLSSAPKPPVHPRREESPEGNWENWETQFLIVAIVICVGYLLLSFALRRQQSGVGVRSSSERWKRWKPFE